MLCPRYNGHLSVTAPTGTMLWETFTFLTFLVCPKDTDGMANSTEHGSEVLFSCSTQLSMNFFLLINVKMPTIV